MAELTMLLVHSPLVGPSSWRPFDDVARDRGIRTIRPNLTGVADAVSPQWRHLVDVAVRSAAGHSDVVVVGHSGAGAVLPAIGERIGSRLRALVFVDAVIPPVEGEHRSSQGLLEFIDDMTVNGRLPRWLDWWPAETVNELVKSPADQEELRADMPRLHRSFYDDPVPVPPDWAVGLCAYLKLSAAYGEEYNQAGELRWPRTSIDGTHLSIFSDPSDVLDTIQSLLSKLETAADLNADGP